MRFSKIIYFRYIPLTYKVYSDFYMKEASEAGANVEYWDLSYLLFRSDFSQEDSSHLATTHKFHSYCELEQAIAKQDLEKTLFISIVTYDGLVIRLFKLLTKYNCTLAVFGRNMFPMTASGQKKLSDLKRLFKITPRKLFTYFRTKNAAKLKSRGKIKGYDIMLLGGNKGYLGIGAVDKAEVDAAEKVIVNSDDYDNYLVLKEASRVIDGDYILFLDEYLPLHPDTRLLGIKNIAPEQYYPELNSYFDRVEKQFGMPVVIAAHPKSTKYRGKDYFNARRTLFGQSAVLSRDAHFVIAHDSTSINFPIAFGVRLHFITSRNIEKGINFVHRNVLDFAQYLNCNWQYMDNVDELVNLVEKLPVEAYERYKYDFQCSIETENNLTKNIFIDFICNNA